MEEAAPQRTRTLFAIIAAATSFLIFATTEKCFAKADVRKAIELVQTLRARPDAPTVPEAMVRLHSTDAAQISWSGTLTDNCYGFVRVRAAVPGPGEVIEYQFDVNLSGNRLHPANDNARRLMEMLRDGTLPPAPAGPNLPTE